MHLVLDGDYENLHWFDTNLLGSGTLRIFDIAPDNSSFWIEFDFTAYEFTNSLGPDRVAHVNGKFEIFERIEI